MSNEVIKSVRIDDRRAVRDGSRIDVVQEGKRKYAIWYDHITLGVTLKSPKYDRSYDTYTLINDFLRLDGSQNFMIIQDPYSDTTPILRKYGNSNYYLNNGFCIYIEWTLNGETIISDSDNANSNVVKRVSMYIENLSSEDEKIIGNRLFTIKYDIVKYSSNPADRYQVYNGDMKDSDIIKYIISIIKRQVQNLWGISSYNLDLCNPDTEYCSTLEFKNPVEKANNTLAETIRSNTIGITQSKARLKFNIEGIYDKFTTKSLYNLPDFTIWIGEKPIENYDDFQDLSDLDPIYSESQFSGEEEEEIKFLMDSLIGESGDSELVTSDDLALNIRSSDRQNEKIFQKVRKVNNKDVYNGEIPFNLLKTLDFCGLNLEKKAAEKLNRLNVEFKKKFGSNIPLSGAYRSFNVQNQIFDWEYYNINKKKRKKGTNGKIAAAAPGTSNHGWGLAIDTSGIGDVGSERFDWLDKYGKAFDWINPEWAKKPGAGHEPWHWEYIGDDIFRDVA